MIRCVQTYKGKGGSSKRVGICGCVFGDFMDHHLWLGALNARMHVSLINYLFLSFHFPPPLPRKNGWCLSSCTGIVSLTHLPLDRPTREHSYEASKRAQAGSPASAQLQSSTIHTYSHPRPRRRGEGALVFDRSVFRGGVRMDDERERERCA